MARWGKELRRALAVLQASRFYDSLNAALRLLFLFTWIVKFVDLTKTVDLIQIVNLNIIRQVQLNIYI